MNWLAWEHWGYAVLAVVGTGLAVWAVDHALMRPAVAHRLKPYRGVVAPFINVNAMLFGLTLAFIADDTWSSRDRAMDAVFREADSLRSLIVLSEAFGAPLSAQLTAAATTYGAAAAAEFSALRQSHADPAASAAADALLALAASPALRAAAGDPVQSQILDKVMLLRDDHDMRVALMQTHLNPLKWLGMAILGFLTILSIAAVHLENVRAGTFAIAIFALASAPTSALVLVQGNPFQEPAAVTAAPILDAIR